MGFTPAERMGQSVTYPNGESRDPNTKIIDETYKDGSSIHTVETGGAVPPGYIDARVPKAEAAYQSCLSDYEKTLQAAMDKSQKNGTVFTPPENACHADVSKFGPDPYANLANDISSGQLAPPPAVSSEHASQQLAAKRSGPTLP